MLIAPTVRSNIYLQTLLNHDIQPAHVILLKDSSSTLLPGQLPKSVLDKFQIDELTTFFNPDVTIKSLLEQNQLSYSICPTHDINSQDCLKALSQRAEPYCIYSGFGGALLRSEILNIGKNFLHCHSGKIPEYRGSTTTYYHVLNDDQCWVSAIFLVEEIDEGPLLATKSFDLPKNGELIDYVYDPYIRSVLLVDVIKGYLAHGSFQELPIDNNDSETYFIIHPVLKHLAILACDNQKQ